MYIKSLSEEQKFAIAYNRNESIFRVFYLSNYKLLQNYAFQIIKDRHLSEDVASEILWKIWHLGEDLIHVASVEQYMFRSVKNKCLNLLRVKNLVFATNEELEIQDKRIDTCSPEHIVVISEAVNRIHNAVEALPEQTKKAFKYIKEDRISYKEAAQKMGISVKTVDRHIQNAVKKLWISLKK